MTAVEQDTIDITPDWESTLQWLAENMAEHGFIRGSYTSMHTILHTAGYLARHDPQALERVLSRLERKNDWLDKED